jgi:type VI secretion system protein ImpL
VFSRKSGKPVSEGVPGLYTPDGYWKSFNGQIDSVTTALHEDDAWVLGAATAQEDKQQIDNAVRQLYMRDFIANWDRFLADIQLNNSADLSQRINTARLLSGANSPLRRLVQNLSQVLTLSRNAPAPEDADKAQAQSNRATRTLEALFSNNDAAPTQAAVVTQAPEQLVTDHYAPMIELAQPLEKGGKTIVFDDFLKQVDELYRYLTAVQDAPTAACRRRAARRSAACRPAPVVCRAGCKPCSAIWRWAPAAIPSAATWKTCVSGLTLRWADSAVRRLPVVTRWCAAPAPRSPLTISRACLRRVPG